MAMEDIDKLEEKFDVVISSLAIHYIKNYDKLIKDIYDSCTSFLFSLVLLITGHIFLHNPHSMHSVTSG